MDGALGATTAIGTKDSGGSSDGHRIGLGSPRISVELCVVTESTFVVIIDGRVVPIKEGASFNKPPSF